MQESGKPVAEVIWELGITGNLLYRWRGENHNAKRLEAPRTAPMAEAEKLVRLKRELDIVKKGERDFLKSAAAYFALERL